MCIFKKIFNSHKKENRNNITPGIQYVNKSIEEENKNFENSIPSGMKIKINSKTSINIKKSTVSYEDYHHLTNKELEKLLRDSFSDNKSSYLLAKNN